MSEHDQEKQGPADAGSDEVGVPDEALPDDLVPGEDNPLAEGLPDGETVEGLLDESGDADDEDPTDDDRAGDGS